MKNRSLPLYTVGDAATDKARERSYFDHNWKPVTGVPYLVNDRGQVRKERRKEGLLRKERRKQPRGGVARGETR